MSENNEPTTGQEKRLSLHSQLQKTRSWVVLVVGSLFTVVMIGFQAAQFMNTLATKQQVEQLRDYMVSENVKLKQELDRSTKHESELNTTVLELQDALEDHLEHHVSVMAAERISDKRKAAKAAADARRRFHEVLDKGGTLREAVAATYNYFPFE